jgi:hypothetical protein
LNYTTASTPTFVRIRLEGSWDGISFFPISDDATDLPSGQVFGVGSYPVVRANLLAITSLSTVTAFYSGASALSGPPLGTYNIAQQTRKVIFTNASEGSTASVVVNAPTMSSGGTLVLVSNGASFPAGGSIQVNAQYGAALAGVTTNQAMGTGAIQSFQIPATLTNQVQVQYNSGGASATTFNAYYFFSQQGQGSYGADPCASNGIPKSSAVVNAAAAATTQIIAGAALQTIFVCGYEVSQVATAGTLQWTTGTGGTCAANTVLKTGAMGVTASQPISYSGPGTVFSAAIASAVCLTTTGAGGTAAGIVTFVQE